MAKLWYGICTVGHGIGLVVNAVILALFYFLVFGPFALFARLFSGDALALRCGDRPSFWCARRPDEASLERARRQS